MSDRVYVLWHQHHEDASVIGVFRSPGGALLARETYPVESERPHLTVEEFILDRIDPNA